MTRNGNGKRKDDVGVTEPRHSLSALFRMAFGVGALLGLVGLYWGLSETGVVATLGDEQALRAWIDQLGPWGPLAIILIMVTAIVMSPIPSGPVALVAGAAYGPLWGTVFVVTGAELGALLAFWLARYLGYDALQRWGRLRPLLRRLDKQRSQTWLMGLVFVTRLIPFISFDAVSYAAGLTPLAFWRFAGATLAGVVPVAFLLTYLGNLLVGVDATGMTTLLFFVSSITLFPVLVRWLWKCYRKRGT